MNIQNLGAGEAAGDGAAEETQAVSLRRGGEKKGKNGWRGKAGQEAANANEVKEPQK